jgi:hypothetical protein
MLQIKLLLTISGMNNPLVQKNIFTGGAKSIFTDGQARSQYKSTTVQEMECVPPVKIRFSQTVQLVSRLCKCTFTQAAD